MKHQLDLLMTAVTALSTKLDQQSHQLAELDKKVEQNSVHITDLYQLHTKLMSNLQEWRQEVDRKFEEQWVRTVVELNDLRKRIDAIQEQTAKNAELMPLVLDSNHELKAHRQVFVDVYKAVNEQLKIG